MLNYRGLIKNVHQFIDEYDIKELQLVLRKGRKILQLSTKYAPIENPHLNYVGKITPYTISKLIRDEIFWEGERAIKKCSADIWGIGIRENGAIELTVEAHTYHTFESDLLIGNLAPQREERWCEFEDNPCANHQLITMRDFIKGKGYYDFDSPHIRLHRPSRVPHKLFLEPVLYSPSHGLIPWEDIVSQLKKVYLHED